MQVNTMCKIIQEEILAVLASANGRARVSNRFGGLL